MQRSRDAEFLYELGSLRHVDRTWKHFNLPGVANVTEHSFRVMWIALVLARREGITNISRVLQMALIHDIPEIRTGDVNYLSREYAIRKEDAAITEMLEGTTLHDWKTVFKEYEERISPEAKIVKDADILDQDLELCEAKARGHTAPADWQPMREDIAKRLLTASARTLWNEIHGTNPNSWHLNARNRYTKGDWKPTPQDTSHFSGD